MVDVCVIGLGYVGLPTALLIADAGHRVQGVDIDNQILSSISNQDGSCLEPEVASLFASVLTTKRFEASRRAKPADIFIICVSTPTFDQDDALHNADLSHVYSAIESIIPILKPHNIVLLESTCPMGTTDAIDTYLMTKLQSDRPLLAYCPERILPGNSLAELRSNVRIVGGTTEKATERAAVFLSDSLGVAVEKTTAKGAEAVKLFENSYRDTMIAFANELDNICDDHGLNSRQIIDLANLHPRVSILNPGIGVGGHCIPVDPWFLINSVDSSKSTLLQAARVVNTSKTTSSGQKIIEWLSGMDEVFNEILVAGVAFKPDVADIRNSPALEIVKMLTEHNINVCICDHLVKDDLGLKRKNIAEGILEKIPVIVLVWHSEFISLKSELLNYSYFYNRLGEF